MRFVHRGRRGYGFYVNMTASILGRLRMTDNTPEYVAFLLMEKVNEAEGTVGTSGREVAPKRGRKEILDLYAECLQAVRNAPGRVAAAQGN
jgi:hypothetical protein